MRAQLNEVVVNVDLIDTEAAQAIASDAMAKGFTVHAYPSHGASNDLPVRLTAQNEFAGATLVALLQLLVKHGDREARLNLDKLVTWFREDYQPPEDEDMP